MSLADGSLRPKSIPEKASTPLERRRDGVESTTDWTPPSFSNTLFSRCPPTVSREMDRAEGVGAPPQGHGDRAR